MFFFLILTRILHESMLYSSTKLFKIKYSSFGMDSDLKFEKKDNLFGQFTWQYLSLFELETFKFVHCRSLYSIVYLSVYIDNF